LIGLVTTQAHPLLSTSMSLFFYPNPSLAFRPSPFVRSPWSASWNRAPVNSYWGAPRAFISHQSFEDSSDEEDPFEELFEALSFQQPIRRSKQAKRPETSCSKECGNDCDCDEECDNEGVGDNVEPQPTSAPAAGDWKSSNQEAPKEPTELAKVSDANASQLFKPFVNDENKFEVKESDEAVTVSSTWEGYDKSDLKVDFKDGSLIVSGKSVVENKDEATGSFARSTKSVSRRIRLPENIDKEGIRAKFKDDSNTLTVTVPRAKKETQEDPIVIN